MGMAENEEKKRYLRGYRDSVRRIKRIESEIEELRTMRMGMSTGGGGTGRKGWKSDLSGYAASLDGLERELSRERANRMQIFKEVKKSIESLEDAQEQDVLFYRYVKGLTWWEIVEKMNYSERWILKIHGRALTHLKLLKEFIEVQ